MYRTKAERNEINLLVKSQMKERNIEELFTDAMNECAVSCEVGTEGFCPGTKRRGPDANHPP